MLEPVAAAGRHQRIRSCARRATSSHLLPRSQAEQPTGPSTKKSGNSVFASGCGWRGTSGAAVARRGFGDQADRVHRGVGRPPRADGPAARQNLRGGRPPGSRWPGHRPPARTGGQPAAFKRPDAAGCQFPAGSGPRRRSASWAGQRQADCHSPGRWRGGVRSGKRFEGSGGLVLMCVGDRWQRTNQQSLGNRGEQALEQAFERRRIGPCRVATGSVVDLPLEFHSRAWCWWGGPRRIPTCSPWRR